MIYRYKAISGSGAEIVERGEFESLVGLEAHIQAQGLELVEARPDLLRTLFTPKTNAKPREQALIDFFAYMSNLMAMGLDMTSALRTAGDSLEDKVLVEAIEKIVGRIEKGYSLSESMAESKIFPRLALASIEAGEVAGRLEPVFLQLSNHFRDMKALKDNAKKVAMYPLISLLVLAAIMSMLLVLVVPQLEEVLPKNLPLVTRIVLGISHFLRNAWWSLPIFPVLFIVAKRNLPESAKIKIWETVYKLPYVGALTKELALANLFMNLGMLTAGGVTILESLDTAAKTAASPVIKTKVTAAKDFVLLGMSLADAFADAFFPPLVNKAVRQGEMTGLLGDYFDQLAGFLKSRVNARVTFLSTFIEPAITLVGGGLLMLISIAIFLPIYGQLENFGN